MAAIGPGYAGLAGFAPGWLTISGLGFLTLGLAGFSLRRLWPETVCSCWTRATTAGLARPRTALAGFAILAGCIGLLLGFDWQGFRHGFFRLDDFEILWVARSLPVTHQVLRLHGDHTLPLYRLEVFALVSLFGPSVGAFNAVNCALLVGMLLAGCWLLAELEAGYMALVVFACANWFWPGWGEYTSGYYLLSVYPQSVMFGFASIAMLRRAMQLDSWLWLGASMTCAGVAGGIDLAGGWIIPALAIFGWAFRSTASAPNRMMPRFLAGLTMLTSLIVAYDAVLFSAGGFLAQKGDASRHFLELALAFVSGLGGATILSAFFPFSAGSLNSHGVIHGVELAALLAAVFVARWWYQQQTLSDRRLFVAMITVIMLLVAMIVIARPTLEAGFFWPPKWTGMVHCWFALALAFAFDRAKPREFEQAVAATKYVFALLCAGAWASLTSSHLMLAMHSPVGRLHNVELAQARRAEFDRLQSDLKELGARLAQPSITLPAVASTRLYDVFPRLEGYPLPYLLAAIPSAKITVAEKPAGISDRLHQALQAIPDLNRVYFTSPTERARP